jgi:hypothetical protein
MIQRKPAQRLGVGGIQEIKNHPWLKNFPWQELYERKISPIFIPPVFSQINSFSERR